MSGVYETLVVVSVLTSGLYAGLSFGITANPSLATLSSRAYLEYWQALNRDYMKLMPALLTLGLAASLGVTVSSVGKPLDVLAANAVAVASIVVVAAITMARVVPLNVQAEHWSADRPADGWEYARERWRSYHMRRTVAAVTGFIGSALVPVLQLRN